MTWGGTSVPCGTESCSVVFPGKVGWSQQCGDTPGSWQCPCWWLTGWERSEWDESYFLPSLWQCLLASTAREMLHRRAGFSCARPRLSWLQHCFSPTVLGLILSYQSCLLGGLWEMRAFSLKTSYSQGTGSLRVPEVCFPSSEAPLWLWAWYQDSSSAAECSLEVQRPESWAGTGRDFPWHQGGWLKALKPELDVGL